MSSAVSGLIAALGPTALDSPFVSRVDAIAEGIKGGIGSGQDESLQCEFARLTLILERLYRNLDLGEVVSAEIALKALVQDKPNLALAKEVLDKLEVRVRRSVFTALLRMESAPTRVILGLGVLLYFGLPSGYFLFRQVSGVKDILGVNVSMLIGVALAGALGSVVSIMVRIHEFALAKVNDPSILFFTGFFKPIIGMSFAMFVFACLNAGILPLAIKVDSAAASYFFLALGFVSGFSERFATDVASLAEKSVRSPSR
jgi:hypothetical protein